jgi:protein phosphatase
MYLQGVGETHRGHVRSSNQDAFVVDPAVGLYAVFDGMGGTAAGDVAARLAAEKLREFVGTYCNSADLAPSELLELGINAAAEAVFAAAEGTPEYNGMGTTVVACLVVSPTHVVIGHAGDSRAYLWRAGHLEALTRDHTVAQRMADDGSMNSDQTELTNLRNMLTEHLGLRDVQADILETALLPGDRLLLCSDGLYSSAPLNAIERLLGSAAAPEQGAHELVELALAGEALDNITAVVLAVELSADEREESDKPGTAAARRRRPRTTLSSALFVGGVSGAVLHVGRLGITAPRSLAMWATGTPLFRIVVWFVGLAGRARARLRQRAGTAC